MRIIAGAARGRRLVAPAGDTVRPTADRVREALFSSLAPLLPGATVLDAFAGSGALGLEARSRGAAHVTLVEQDRRALVALRRNVDTVALGATDVVAGDVLRMAATGRLAGAPFDLVLLDPPYALTEDELARLLADLEASLAEDATVVVERAASAPAPRWPGSLRSVSERRYGSTRLHRAERTRDEVEDDDGGEGAA
jgi:16S rRNA (guanine966-N2)-methyltransferase